MRDQSSAAARASRRGSAPKPYMPAMLALLATAAMFTMAVGMLYMTFCSPRMELVRMALKLPPGVSMVAEEACDSYHAIVRGVEISPPVAILRGKLGAVVGLVRPMAQAAHAR